jgi:dehydrogenase/reductase SDR family member 1
MIALVTGASRGVGRGVALGLAERGATIYITGRTLDGAQGLAETAAQVKQLGGHAIPIVCDHTYDTQVETVFDRIRSEQPHLDLLVNNAWAGYERMGEMLDDKWVFTWNLPFWEQPRWRWNAMMDAGVRAAFISSQLAAGMMVPRKCGLIVNISFWAAQKYLTNVIYGMAKSATDKMTADSAKELTPHNVSVVSLYPGLVRTEAVMAAAQYFDLGNSESPQFVGRAIAALAQDPDVLSKTGQVLVAAQLALEYGFTDIDGKQPRPLTIADV